MLVKHKATLVIISLAGASYASIQADNYYALCGCIILTSLNNTKYATEANKILQTISVGANDQERCNSWNAYPNYTITTWPDETGLETSNLSLSIGIFANDAYAFCGPPIVKQVRCYPT
jgi:hypothetical protein